MLEVYALPARTRKPTRPTLSTAPSVSSPCEGEDEGEGPTTAKRIKILFCLLSLSL